MVEKLEEREKTSWNLSEYKINIIGSLMQLATENSIKGNHPKSFSCWQQIALIIGNRLEKEEKEKINELRKEVSKGIKYISEEENPYLDKNERIVFEQTYYFYVEDYITYINKLLKDIGLDLKTKDMGEEEME